MNATQTDRRTSTSIMDAHTAKAAGSQFRENKWGERHEKAWSDAALFAAHGHRLKRTEQPVANLIRAWVHYADAHRTQHESGIGDDGVIGEGWRLIGKGLQTLLNADLGRLDGGTLSSILGDVFENEGFDDNGDDNLGKDDQ